MYVFCAVFSRVEHASQNTAHVALKEINVKAATRLLHEAEEKDAEVGMERNVKLSSGFAGCELMLHGVAHSESPGCRAVRLFIDIKAVIT